MKHFHLIAFTFIALVSGCMIVPIPVKESYLQFQWVEHEKPTRSGFLIFTEEKKVVVPVVYFISPEGGIHGSTQEVSKTHFRYFLTTQEDQALSVPGSMVPYDISKAKELPFLELTDSLDDSWRRFALLDNGRWFAIRYVNWNVGMTSPLINYEVVVFNPTQLMSRQALVIGGGYLGETGEDVLRKLNYNPTDKTIGFDSTDGRMRYWLMKNKLEALKVERPILP